MLSCLRYVYVAEILDVIAERCEFCIEPARRSADGPMSTPRRPAPDRAARRGSQSAINGIDASGPCAIEHARIWDRFPHVFQSAHPRDEAFDAHAESAVRHRAEAAQIQIPLEGFARKLCSARRFRSRARS